MNRPRVLFLGHDAARCGAPLLLLHLLKWLGEQGRIPFELLLLAEGVLTPEYRRVCCTHVLATIRHRHAGHRILRRLRLCREAPLARTFPREQFPVIYANTMAACEAALPLAADGRRLILHVHELAYTCEILRARDALHRAAALPTTFIAASDAVRQFLISQAGVADSQIELVYEFPVSPPLPQAEALAARRSLRGQLGIADTTPVFGMCGTADWRKGADLFVLLAKEMQRRRGRQFMALWLGGSPSDHGRVNHDIRAARLNEVCRFLPATPEPQAFFAALDVFSLTSREDAFPVAMLEAAAAGLPVVCFRQSGGAPEFVAEDAGILVPYLDVPQCADACETLFRSADLRRELGMKGREKAATRFSLAQHVAQVARILDRLHPRSTGPT